MIAQLVLALQLAAAPAAPAASGPRPASTLAGVAQAIQSGRFDQARLMIARSIALGTRGPAVDRLVADLAFASGRDAEALAAYQQVVAADPTDRLACEQGGISALRLGRLGDASRLIDCSTSAGATWRAWNAKGVLSDLQADWNSADAAFARAIALSPNEPTVLNNQGWSFLLRGDWAVARDLFGRAASLEPSSRRISNNLELAETALAADLPRRRAGESSRSWAERLNDAGVAAELLGDQRRAMSAFTQAIEASGSWYARAANNLASVSGQ